MIYVVRVPIGTVLMDSRPIPSLRVATLTCGCRTAVAARNAFVWASQERSEGADVVNHHHSVGHDTKRAPEKRNNLAAHLSRHALHAA